MKFEKKVDLFANYRCDDFEKEDKIDRYEHTYLQPKVIDSSV